MSGSEMVNGDLKQEQAAGSPGSQAAVPPVGHIGGRSAPLGKPEEPAELMAQRIRLEVLRQSRRANVGHIGSALSIADIIAALYSGAMDVVAPGDPERDRFVLSKGHAALALYCALHLRGWLTSEQLDSYCADGTLLAVHPECALTGVDFTTGSLGHGLSLGAGAALAARIQGSARRAFVLVSDAECNEGSVWEAAMFAGHHRLGNLIALVDQNGQQALGYTPEVLNLEPMSSHWRNFGWDVHEVDGHDPQAMIRTIGQLGAGIGPPHVLIARTVFGKGVSFMQSQLRWHYVSMSEDQYREAVGQLGGNL